MSEKSMETLSKLIQKLQAQLSVCTRCGVCQGVCPLYERTQQEADVARGKLALIHGLMTNMFTDPDGVHDRLNRCLLCGSCAAHCPSGVNAVDIFIKTRILITEYKGLPPLKKFVFRKMLADPERFDTLFDLVHAVQPLFLRRQTNRQETSCARTVLPKTERRYVKEITHTPFHKMVPAIKTNVENPAATVVFFSGCLIDKLFPGVAADTVDVLRHHGMAVHIPLPQGCCGLPALASGDLETFTTLLDHHLHLFSDLHFDYLVTACATCTATIKKLWPALYNGKDPDKKAFLAALSEKTLDISQLLVLKGTLDTVSPEYTAEAVTYHDPCHLRGTLNVANEPRTLIKAAGKKLVEMKNPEACCGMGGSFSIRHYGLSSEIGAKKAASIMETGCSTVATSCPACMIQIADMLTRTGGNIYVKHPVQLYRSALSGAT